MFLIGSPICTFRPPRQTKADRGSYFIVSLCDKRDRLNIGQKYPYQTTPSGHNFYIVMGQSRRQYAHGGRQEAKYRTGIFMELKQGNGATATSVLKCCLVMKRKRVSEITIVNRRSGYVGTTCNLYNILLLYSF